MKRILAFLLVLIAVSAQAQAITRKAVYKKGQEFLMTASNKTETIYSMMGQKRELVNQMELSFLVAVNEVSDTAYVLTNTLTRRQLHLKAMGNEQNLDSDSAHHAGNTMMGKALMEGIGENSRVLVDKSGNTIIQEDTAQTKEEAAAAESLGNALNKNKRPGIRYDMTPPLPEKPIRLGDEWTESSDTDGYKGIIVFKLVSIEKGVATVNHSGKISKVVESNNNGITMVMRTEGTSSGSYTFDIKTGILKTNSNITESAGTMEAGGQSIPVTIKMVSSLVVKPKVN